MRELSRAKRRILTASAGAAVFTALEGLACGNPVEPGYLRNGPGPMPAEAPAEPPSDAAVDAADDAPIDAGADAP
ncbi:MAG TPA: hypothetical protein VE093_28720 [Polyangiaceae bacterium]|nr:hypothetical protein [Polyangiaceae bacterium]